MPAGQPLSLIQLHRSYRNAGELLLPRFSVYRQPENASVLMFTVVLATGATAGVDISSAGVATEQSRVVEELASKAIPSATYAAEAICASDTPPEAHAPA